MEEKSTLEYLKEQMTHLSKCIQDIEESIAELEMIPLIAKYNASLYDREKLQEEYKIKQAEYEGKFQQEFSHPLHYLMFSNLRILTNTTTNICKSMCGNL